jgi:hypothetical protein
VLLGWPSDALGFGGKINSICSVKEDRRLILDLEQYNGQQGVELMLDILYQDFKRCMQLAGCKSISEIGHSSLGIFRSDGPLARL